MNIDLFVSKKGHVVLACHGEFKQDISQIVVDGQTGDVSIIFKPDLKIWHTNCSIDQELCNKIKNQLFCAIGYFDQKKLIAAEYVRFMCRM